MLDYPKALRSASVGILLSLAWYIIWLLSYLLLYGVLNLYNLATFVFNVSLWISFIVAVLSLVWSFFRGKPYIAYAGLHVFCWLSFYGLAVLTNTGLLFVGPLVFSLLLFLFLKPIITSLTNLQRLIGVLVGDFPPRGIPKQAVEDPISYEDGYKTMPSAEAAADDEWNIPTLQSKAVYEEGERYYPYPDHDLKQTHIQDPQSYQ